MNKNESRIIKYLFGYMQVIKYLFPTILVVGFITGISTLISNGDIRDMKFSVWGLKLIDMPKVTIITPFIDGIIVISFGIIVSLLLIIILLKFSKFIKNIRHHEILSVENGTILEGIGKIMLASEVIGVIYELVFNKNNNTELYKHFIEMFIFMLFIALTHPDTILALFFILFGYILKRASIIKQENDLTV